MANKHVVGSHFKEEHMQPLHPFAMRHVNEIQVSCPSVLSRTERLVFSNQRAFKNQGGIKYWVNLSVKTCDIFSLFCMLMLGFGLMLSRLFCLLLFMSSVSLIGFCNEDELEYYWDVICWCLDELAP